MLEIDFKTERAASILITGSDGFIPDYAKKAIVSFLKHLWKSGTISHDCGAAKIVYNLSHQYCIIPDQVNPHLLCAFPQRFGNPHFIIDTEKPEILYQDYGSGYTKREDSCQ